MRGQTHPPKKVNQTILDGGTKLGIFWNHCKRTKKKWTKPPYDRLLTNPVFKAHYHFHGATNDTWSSERDWGVLLRGARRTWITYSRYRQKKGEFPPDFELIHFFSVNH